MFDETQSGPILVHACQQLGLDPHRAVLLRHHTNAVYSVDDVVIKIAPPSASLDRLTTVIAMVNWFTRTNFPTALLYPGLTQPLNIHGYAVTAWLRMDAQRRPVTIFELAHLLKRLHSLEPPAIELPTLDPIISITRSVNQATMLDDRDRGVLITRLNRLASAWAPTDFPLGLRLIQSDPQLGNTLRRHDGTAVLSDWDGISMGPPEWDIATVAVHCERFRQHTFDDFAEAYGWIDTWPEFRNLVALRELQMIATNARKSAPGTPAADQVRYRIDSLYESTKAVWTIL